MYWQLARQSLATARTVTGTSAALVCVSVVCVVGAERAFGRLAHVVSVLADGGTEHTATVDVSRCAWCVRVRRGSTRLQSTVDEVWRTRVYVHLHAPDGRAVRDIAVHCLPASRPPHGVQWARGSHAVGWTDAVGAPTVVAGMRLMPLISGNTVRTTAGVWHVAGHARLRPALSSSAGENEAILVPNRAPFTTVCAAGTPLWRLAAGDSTALHRKIGRTVEELRTAAGMRPGVHTPWQIQRTDRFAVVVQRLVERFRTWVLLVPGAVALLCGAGVFSVQTLQSDQRTAEFGVRRAVGASRRALVGQLLAEATATGALGVASAGLLLHVAGLFDGTASGVWRSLLLAVAVAMPLAVIGLLVPGLAALRASSIAQLEGRGA